MPYRKNELSRIYLLVLIFLVLSLYPVTVSFLGSRRAFEVGNVVLLSMSIGIMVAYLPEVLSSFRHRLIDGAGVAAISIFLCYGGIATGRALSIAWRLAGKPPEWLDTTLWASQNALLLTASVTLTLAPQAVAGRVPPLQWMKMGAFVAASVFIAAWYVTLYVIDD